MADIKLFDVEKPKSVGERGETVIRPLSDKAKYEIYSKWYKEAVDGALEKWKKTEPYKSSLSKEDWDTYYNSVMSQPPVVKFEDGRTDYDKSQREYVRDINDWIINDLSRIINDKRRLKNGKGPHNGGIRG